MNQDQTINSPTNPAAPGTVITVWATGADSSCFPDGDIQTDASAYSELPVSVLWTPPILGGNPTELYSLDVLYAGAAPGLVCGVLQINFRLADSFPEFTQGIGVQLQIGPAVSQKVYVYVHP